MVTGNRAFINNINTVTSNIQSGMFLPVQYAAIEVLDHPRFRYNQLNNTNHSIK